MYAIGYASENQLVDFILVKSCLLVGTEKKTAAQFVSKDFE